jgi:hypothetical protein
MVLGSMRNPKSYGYRPVIRCAADRGLLNKITFALLISVVAAVAASDAALATRSKNSRNELEPAGVAVAASVSTKDMRQSWARTARVERPRQLQSNTTGLADPLGETQFAPDLGRVGVASDDSRNVSFAIQFANRSTSLDCMRSAGADFRSDNTQTGSRKVWRLLAHACSAPEGVNRSGGTEWRGQ